MTEEALTKALFANRTKGSDSNSNPDRSKDVLESEAKL